MNANVYRKRSLTVPIDHSLQVVWAEDIQVSDRSLIATTESFNECFLPGMRYVFGLFCRELGRSCSNEDGQMAIIFKADSCSDIVLENCVSDDCVSFVNLARGECLYLDRLIV